MYLVCFQSGGGGGGGGVAVVAAAPVHCLEIHWARKVALVGKIHMYSLSLLPFE